MYTLFGNDLAVQYARKNSQHDYPAGSVLSLVAWNQQEDPRWFGGNLPATPKSVEFVTVGVAPDHRPLYSYQDFEGAPFKKVSTQESPRTCGVPSFSAGCSNAITASLFCPRHRLFADPVEASMQCMFLPTPDEGAVQIWRQSNGSLKVTPMPLKMYTDRSPRVRKLRGESL